MPREISTRLDATGMRFGIVAARFNSFLVEQLVSGAVEALVRHGASDNNITLAHVPGSFEIPLAAKKIAQSGTVDCVVALGVIIRGATSHYDHVCSGATSGIQSAALETGIPIMFGVVTADNIEQAIERCGTKAGNKGADAAVGGIEMVQLFREMSKSKM